MTKYTFGIDKPHQQYIHISVEFETKGDITTLQLPSWRPGRYELANFAKNINNLKVYNSKQKVIAAEKLNKDSWTINTSKTDSIKVEYKYYAIEMNAGSSLLDKDQLYVNPVNCCMYDPETYDDSVEIVLNIPKKWEQLFPPNNYSWELMGIIPIIPGNNKRIGTSKDGNNYFQLFQELFLGIFLEYYSRVGIIIAGIIPGIIIPYRQRIPL